MSTNDLIFSAIVFLIAASASNVPGNTNSTVLPPLNTSKCAAITVNCTCPDRYNVFEIHHVDNCSDTKDICVRHMNKKCRTEPRRLVKCVFYNPEAPKGPPDVRCPQIVSDSYEDEPNVFFSCYIKSKTRASARWHFKGESILQRIASEFYSSQQGPNPSIACHQPNQSTLTLYSIKPKLHEGDYTCIAQNQFGQGNCTIRMNVGVPTKDPIRIFCEKDNKAYLGASFNITCTAVFTNKNGPWNGSYKRRNIKVKDDSRHNLYQEMSKPTFIMMINNVSEEDAGNWEFVAHQSPYTKTKTIELHVVACPKGHYCPKNKRTAIPCPSGTYNDGKLNITYYCQPCPKFTANDRKSMPTGAISIEKCPKEGPSSPAAHETAKIAYKLTLVIVGVGLVVIVGFVIYMCRKRRRNKLVFQVPDVDADIPLIYDVFISFSEKDHEFGQRLQSNIEDQGYRCCYHHRDFVPGESIVQNIADAIYQSTVTLVVLSPSYLDSKFCKHELRQALTAAVERRRILPVLYKPCTPLPRELSSLPYVEYKSERERDFWRKLLDALKKSLSLPIQHTKNHDSQV